MNIPCMADSDRWSTATTDDPEARRLCRSCPIRYRCAHDALMLNATSTVTGIWGGVFLPDINTQPSQNRRRTYALRILASLVEFAKEHHVQPLAG